MTEDIDYNVEIPKLSLEAQLRIHRIMYLDQVTKKNATDGESDPPANDSGNNNISRLQK